MTASAWPTHGRAWPTSASRFDATTGRWTSQQREHLIRAKATLRRLEAGLARRAEVLGRGGVRDARDAASVEREIADTDRSRTSRTNAASDDAQQGDARPPFAP